jgi:alpha-amylase/alpha-mannosidase (GH57 family)
MSVKLNILLHMHQPDYRPAAGGKSLLPWVRLHAVRGYLDVAEALSRAKALRATVNFSGVLLEQLDLHSQGYKSGDLAPDTWAELCTSPLYDWTPEQREFAVYNFFSANLERIIRPFPRYSELYDKRLAGLGGKEPSDPAALKAAAARFNYDELRDLCVCFNLAWLGFRARELSHVQRLFLKGAGYSAEDLNDVLGLHGRLVQGVLPRYRELAQSGRAELSFTPFHHALLPLLIDLKGEGHLNPDDQLPEFKHPEDAAEQVRLGQLAFEALFDYQPRGCWPAEGSVSDAALSMLAVAGIDWCMTDQANLPAQSTQALSHCQPWRIKTGAGKPITVFFRDTRLSDNLGFEYARWAPKDAAAHFVENVVKLGRSSGYPRPVVTVVLDGENPWENYEGGGDEFLKELDSAIAAEPELECCLASELASESGWPEGDHIESGSWIGGNFDIWTRHRDTRTAWRRLAKARAVLDRQMDKPEVRRHLLAAEASDWFWWYGDDFESANKDIFDALFKSRIEAALAAANAES